MFETEDMLPRPPPKPSAPPLPSEGSVQPEVPEISIIFGKPTPTSATQTMLAQQPPSYADWKKQVLPRATYQPVSKDEAINFASDNEPTRSTVFPLRATTPNTASQVNNIEHLNAMDLVDKSFRHSLENTCALVPSQKSHMQKNEHRRSVDSLSQRNSGFTTERTLTICASTQTDFTSTAADNSIQELHHILKAVNELQENQRQIRRLLEVFMMQQDQKQQQNMMVSSVFCCDVATQCDFFKDEQAYNGPQTSNLDLNTGTIHQALPNIKIYSPVVKDICHSVEPNAQSPHYRLNKQLLTTNKPQLLQANLATFKNSYVPDIRKVCTEQSMVMNELAFKYLPSDKVNQILQDINIAAETTPLREIDNFNKAPTDISTASYHYLRKYRLLPQQQQQKQQTNMRTSSSPSGGFNLLESKSDQQNDPLKESPIVINNEAESECPYLDLEHIKRQPKFL